jgi:hypothetical protein
VPWHDRVRRFPGGVAEMHRFPGPTVTPETMRKGSIGLEVDRVTRGRMVLCGPGGVLHLARGYELLRSEDDGVRWHTVGHLPRAPWRRIAEYSRLARRLIRHEVRALAQLSNGRYVASNREGVFHGSSGSGTFERSAVESRELPLMPPMRLTVGPRDVVVFGEYGGRGAPRPIRLFASTDGGLHFDVVHSLEAGSVLHIHNLVYDATLDLYWVMSGDRDEESGIGRLSSDLQRFEWFVKGEQRFRAVAVFDLGDHLLYATDTHREPNGLILLDKAKGNAERIREFDGSCIYGCRFGGLYAITTTVEPSTVNQSHWASLWLSRDGLRWREAFRARKDRWNPDYFQFGSLVLPAGESDRETIAFSGQAVDGFDGKTVIGRISRAQLSKSS